MTSCKHSVGCLFGIVTTLLLSACGKVHDPNRSEAYSSARHFLAEDPITNPNSKETSAKFVAEMFRKAVKKLSTPEKWEVKAEGNYTKHYNEIATSVEKTRHLFSQEASFFDGLNNLKEFDFIISNKRYPRVSVVLSPSGENTTLFRKEWSLTFAPNGDLIYSYHESHFLNKTLIENRQFATLRVKEKLGPPSQAMPAIFSRAAKLLAEGQWSGYKQKAGFPKTPFPNTEAIKKWLEDQAEAMKNVDWNSTMYTATVVIEEPNRVVLRIDPKGDTETHTRIEVQTSQDEVTQSTQDYKGELPDGNPKFFFKATRLDSGSEPEKMN